MSDYRAAFAPDTLPRVTDPTSVTLAQSYARELAGLRESARAAGYRDGVADGGAATARAVAKAKETVTSRAAAERADQDERANRALGALEQAVVRLDERSAPAWTELTEVLTRSAVALAEALLERELTSLDDPGGAALQRALTHCPDGAPVLVRLHPDDLTAIDPRLVAGLSERVTLTADAGVEPGGAVAETATTRVDAQLGAALARARKALGL